MAQKYLISIDINGPVVGESYEVSPIYLSQYKSRIGFLKPGCVYRIEDINLSKCSTKFTDIILSKYIEFETFYPYKSKDINLNLTSDDYSLKFKYDQSHRTLIKGKIIKGSIDAKNLVLEVLQCNHKGENISLGEFPIKEDGLFHISVPIQYLSVYKLILSYYTN